MFSIDQVLNRDGHLDWSFGPALAENEQGPARSDNGPTEGNQATPHQHIAGAEEMAKLLRIGFSSPRKTLMNNLRNNQELDTGKLDTAWQQLGLSPTVRPAELTGEQWREIRELVF